jgi:quercetin dioxygenase-like cupin family protein
MKTKMKSLTIAASLILAGMIGYGVAARAQPAGGKADPVKVDPKHYKVEFENDKVRVLRITYAPGEKSVMHYHPDGVAVYLTDGKTRMTTPDGKSQDAPAKAGAAAWTPAGSHLPQNVGDKPFELVLVELKK